MENLDENKVVELSNKLFNDVITNSYEAHKDFYDSYEKLKESFLENETRYISDARIRQSFMQAHEELVKLQLEELTDILKNSQSIEVAVETGIRYFNAFGNDDLSPSDNLYMLTGLGHYDKGHFLYPSPQELKNFITTSFNSFHGIEDLQEVEEKSKPLSIPLDISDEEKFRKDLHDYALQWLTNFDDDIPVVHLNSIPVYYANKVDDNLSDEDYQKRCKLADSVIDEIIKEIENIESDIKEDSSAVLVKALNNLYSKEPEKVNDEYVSFIEALDTMDFYKLRNFLIITSEKEEPVRQAAIKVFEEKTGETFPVFENIDIHDARHRTEMWLAQRTKVEHKDTYNKYYFFTSEQDIVEYIASSGTGTEGGKERINKFFDNNSSDNSRKSFLQEEYGWYGHHASVFSMMCSNSSKGIKTEAYITNPETKEIKKVEKIVSWKELCDEIKRQRLLGIYLKDTKQEEYDFTQPVNISDRFAIDFIKRDDDREPVVRFIDRKYNQITTGQYYISTIISHNKNAGLDLDGGVPEWKVDPESTARAIEICEYYKNNNISVTSNFIEPWEIEYDKKNYVLSKLQAAGIEVVLSKAEFDNILKNHNILQKMETSSTEEKNPLFLADEKELKAFAQKVDDWKSGNLKPTEVISEFSTSTVLQAINIPANKVSIDQLVLKKINALETEKVGNSYGHDIDIETIKKIPQYLSDPIMVYNSASRKDSYTVLTEAVDKNNESILIALQINKFEDGIYVNNITSAYGKDENEWFIEQIKLGNLVYQDKKRSLEWTNPRRLSLPNQMTTQGSLNVIQKEDIVNQKTPNFSLSERHFAFTEKQQEFLRELGFTNSVDGDNSVLDWKMSKTIPETNKIIYFEIGTDRGSVNCFACYEIDESKDNIVRTDLLRRYAEEKNAFEGFLTSISFNDRQNNFIVPYEKLGKVLSDEILEKLTDYIDDKAPKISRENFSNDIIDVAFKNKVRNLPAKFISEDIYSSGINPIGKELTFKVYKEVLKIAGVPVDDKKHYLLKIQTDNNYEYVHNKAYPRLYEAKWNRIKQVYTDEVELNLNSFNSKTIGNIQYIAANNCNYPNPPAQTMTLSDGNTYGFAYEGKIYLNPEIWNSEAAVHEYTHLWDSYTQRTNPELWQRGIEIFENTKLWEEVKADPNYSDIADNNDLVLSEVHARICGKMADKVLERILQEEGQLTHDTVIDWDKETWAYIANEIGFESFDKVNPDLKITTEELKQFLSMPVKDLFINERRITMEQSSSLNLTDNMTEKDFDTLADNIIQQAYENSGDGFNYIMDFETVAGIAGKDVQWVKDNITNICDALYKYNDDFLLEFNEEEALAEENEINMYFCSVGEDANELFKKGEDGRWVRKTEAELRDEEFEKNIIYITHNINGQVYSEPEIEGIFESEIKELFEEWDNGDDNLSFVGIKLYRNPDVEGKINLLVEFDSKDPENKWREEAVYEALKDEKLSLNGMEVDVNPITADKSGTIEQYLEHLSELEKNDNTVSENENIENNSDYHFYYNAYSKEYLALRYKNNDWEISFVDNNFNVITRDIGFSLNKPNNIKEAAERAISLHYSDDNVDYDTSSEEYAELVDNAEKLNIENWITPDSETCHKVVEAIELNDIFVGNDGVYFDSENSKKIIDDYRANGYESAFNLAFKIGGEIIQETIKNNPVLNDKPFTKDLAKEKLDLIVHEAFLKVYENEKWDERITPELKQARYERFYKPMVDSIKSFIDKNDHDIINKIYDFDMDKKNHRNGYSVSMDEDFGHNVKYKLLPELFEITQNEVKKVYEENHIPYVVLLNSESPDFPIDNKVYTLKDFNEKLIEADSNFYNRKKYAEEKYGSYEKYWELEEQGSIPEEDKGISFGYDKTDFKIFNIPNPDKPDDTFSYEPSRYDIGDGNGSVFNYIRSTCSHDEFIAALNDVEKNLYYSNVTKEQQEEIDNIINEESKSLTSSLNDKISIFDKSNEEYKELHKKWLIEAKEAEATDEKIADSLAAIKKTYDDSVKNIFTKVIDIHPELSSFDESAALRYAVNETVKMIVNELYLPSRNAQKAMNSEDFKTYNSIDWEKQRKIWGMFPANVNIDNYVKNLLNESIELKKDKTVSLEETNENNASKNYHFFVKDTAEFEQFADFEPVTNLDSKKAVETCISLNNKGYHAGIGIIVPGTIDHDVENEGIGIDEFYKRDGIYIFNDLFVDKYHSIKNNPDYVLAVHEITDEFKKQNIEIDLPVFLKNKTKTLLRDTVLGSELFNELKEAYINKNLNMEARQRGDTEKTWSINFDNILIKEGMTVDEAIKQMVVFETYGHSADENEYNKSKITAESYFAELYKDVESEEEYSKRINGNNIQTKEGTPQQLSEIIHDIKENGGDDVFVTKFNINDFFELYNNNYQKLYEAELASNGVVAEVSSNVDNFDELIKYSPEFKEAVQELVRFRNDPFSSDRECAAVVKTFNEMGVVFEIDEELKYELNESESNNEHSDSEKNNSTEEIVLTKEDLDLCKKFVPKNQYTYTLELISDSEEKEFFIKTFKNIADKARAMENCESYDEKTNTHKNGFHYFVGGSDFYVCEWYHRKEDNQDIVYGYTILNGDTQFSEFGESFLEEIKNCSPYIEMDYHNNKNTLEEAVHSKYNECFGELFVMNDSIKSFSSKINEILNSLNVKELSDSTLGSVAKLVMKENPELQKNIVKIMSQNGCDTPEKTMDFLYKIKNRDFESLNLSQNNQKRNNQSSEKDDYSMSD